MISFEEKKAIIFDLLGLITAPIGVLIAVLALMKDALKGYMFEILKNQELSLAYRLAVFILSWSLLVIYLGLYFCLIRWKVRQNYLDRKQAAKDKEDEAKNRQDEVEFRDELRAEANGRKSLHNLAKSVEKDGLKLDKNQMRTFGDYVSDIKSTLKDNKKDQEGVIEELKALRLSIDANTEALRKSQAQKTCQCDIDPDSYLSSLTLLFE